MTNSSGTNLDMRSMPERSSPGMDLINGAEAWMPNHCGRRKQVVDEGIPQGQVTGGVLLLGYFLLDEQQEVLYRNVLMLRSHGCEGAVNPPAGGTISQMEYEFLNLPNL